MGRFVLEWNDEGTEISIIDMRGKYKPYVFKKEDVYNAKMICRMLYELEEEGF